MAGYRQAGVPCAVSVIGGPEARAPKSSTDPAGGDASHAREGLVSTKLCDTRRLLSQI